MVIVGKRINGIAINPLEYLLGDDGKKLREDWHTVVASISVM